MSKKTPFLVFLVFLLTMFYMGSYMSSYKKAYARAEDDIFTIPENSFGDISEYVFTMMYFQTGATPCHVITSKRPPSCMADRTPKGCLIEVIDGILELAQNNIPSLGLNKEYIIRHLDNAYNYCLLHPNDIFAKALLATIGVNLSTALSMEDYYQDNANNSSNSPPNSQAIPGARNLRNNKNNRAQQNNNENLSPLPEEQKVRILN